MLRRFDYVARSGDRSMNGLLLALVRRCVKEYERKHGKFEDAEEGGRPGRNMCKGNALAGHLSFFMAVSGKLFWHNMG